MNATDNNLSFEAIFSFYEGYLTDPMTNVITYEELTQDENGMIKLAGFLSVPYNHTFDQLTAGLMPSQENSNINFFNKVHSDYTQIAGITEIFNPQLLTKWGY